MSAHGDKSYPSPGLCIYCGDVKSKLTDEHVVPYALGSKLIIKGASCDVCQKIIHRFEADCLATMLGPYRQRMRYPSRKKTWKKGVIAMPRTIGAGPNFRVVGRREIPRDDHPKIVALPLFGEPSEISGFPNPWEGRLWYWFDPDDIDKFQENMVHMKVCLQWRNAILLAGQG